MAIGAVGTLGAGNETRRLTQRWGRAIYEDLAPSALEFARRLAEVIEPADRAAFDRAIKALSERSAALAAETNKPAGNSGAKPDRLPTERKIALQPRAKEDA